MRLIVVILLLFAFYGCGSSSEVGSEPGDQVQDNHIDDDVSDSGYSTLTVVQTGAGSVLSNPAGVTCGTNCSAQFPVGSTVTLDATPADGYSFNQWSDSTCGTSSSCVISLQENTVIMASFSPVSSTDTKYVPLTLREAPSGEKIPIRTGVPFPIGELLSLDNIRLESNDGSMEIPAQFNTLATWPDGSQKMVLVNIVTDMGNSQEFRIAYGPSVTRAPLSHQIQVTSLNDLIYVDTGLVKLSINSKGILNSLWRDTDNDGTFAENEKVIEDGDIYLINAFNSNEYTASMANDATITIEEDGPMRSVIKAQGEFTSNSSETLLKYNVRYYASLGSDKIDIEMNITDDRLEEDAQNVPATLSVALSELGIRWQYSTGSESSYRFGGESQSVYEGTVTSTHSLLQTGVFNYIDGSDNGHSFSYSGVGTGEKAPGWLNFASDSKNTTVMIRDFWQQFPMELRIDQTHVTAALFSANSIEGTPDTEFPEQSVTYSRPNTLYFRRPGGAKTYYLRLAAHENEPTSADLHDLNDNYQLHELMLVATPKWYTASGVWGEIDVGGPGSSSEAHDYDMLEHVYKPSIENADKQATVYGWRDYGDRLRTGWADIENGVKIPSFYNDTHVGSNNFFWQFIRTGEQRWFHLGEISTRHTMDIDISHGPTQGYWSTGGTPQPAGELRAVNHDTIDHEARNLHFGHAHVSGLSELYLLTGDKRAYEILKEMAGWWEFMAPYYFPLPFEFDDRYREAERDFGWPLYVMNEYVRVSGDYQYHQDVAAQLVSYLIQWWQTPREHYGYNPATGIISEDVVVGTNDASNGTGYWTMTRMDNYGGYDNVNGTNPWMGASILTSVIKFYEQDKLFEQVGQESDLSYETIEDMLLQTLNYIVKYGYDTEEETFVYSEVVRNSSDHKHILYPLAYLDRLYYQKLALGTMPHPEWYDTQPLWSEIAEQWYDELRTDTSPNGTQSYGFYGYEIMYPADFFKIMRDQLGR